LGSIQFRQWVHDQVEQARECFREDQTYIDSLDVLRCRLAGEWYCARFETVLNAIERDGYRLRADYPERHGAMAWMNMVWLGVGITCRHYARRLRMFFFRTYRQAEMQSRMNIPSFHVK
jgi:hypothetical protein